MEVLGILNALRGGHRTTDGDLAGGGCVLPVVMPLGCSHLVNIGRAPERQVQGQVRLEEVLDGSFQVGIRARTLMFGPHVGLCSPQRVVPNAEI